MSSMEITVLAEVIMMFLITLKFLPTPKYCTMVKDCKNVILTLKSQLNKSKLMKSVFGSSRTAGGVQPRHVSLDIFTTL